MQERILLHLLDYSDFKDSIEVPFALSQMGIANAVAIARSNVPRAIAGLKDQGILVERQAHVKGVSRKRKAYFLTDSGITLASETWDRLSDWPVRIVLDDQPAVSTTLGGAKGVLPFEMRPVDIIGTSTNTTAWTCGTYRRIWLNGTSQNTLRKQRDVTCRPATAPALLRSNHRT